MTDNNTFKVSEISAVVNLNAHVTSITENSSDYLSFDLHLISIYMNNQLHYYHMISAMLDTDKAAVKNQLKNCKALLKLIDWDENTQENSSVKCNLLTSQCSVVSHISHALILDYNSKIDSSCLKSISDHKDIKFNLSDITKLQYDSNIAQFNNWLEDFRAAVISLTHWSCYWTEARLQIILHANL